ncbi:MAG: nuclear transport factor 2 family protein [Limnohabitans sp.]|nr:nuclear transport factor 2 family protein [Limnohabitans sp.]
MFTEESLAIQQTIQNYFVGVYNGDLSLLTQAFHSDCKLIGDINGSPYYKNFQEYLEGVKNRKSPKESGESFRMKIISLEILGNNAIVKAQLPMLGFNYYDFLSIAKMDSKWVIVNKLFTNVL